MSTDAKPQTLRVDEFVQGLVRQLDDVQDALALKLRAGRPLSWALKDVSLDLQVFVGSRSDGTLTIRNAAPNEAGASTLHIGLTTIGREAVEENAWDPAEDDDPRSLRSFGRSGGLDTTSVERLEQLGLRTVGQLHRAVETSSLHWVADRSDVPSWTLQEALRRAELPELQSVTPQRSPDGTTVLRMLGVHLSDGRSPEVRLCGEPVPVLQAESQELLVRPLAHHQTGQVEVLVGEERATGWFELATRDQGHGYGGRRGSIARLCAAVLHRAAVDPDAGQSKHDCQLSRHLPALAEIRRGADKAAAD